jgi:hypothetical protein
MISVKKSKTEKINEGNDLAVNLCRQKSKIPQRRLMILGVEIELIVRNM